MDQPILGISGLRGRPGRELTPEIVRRMSARFGSFAGPGVFALGRDTRPSGAVLGPAAAAGLNSVGCTVEDIGICPTPTVLHHVRQQKLQGALVVTASHNPEEWNGIKFAGPGGRFLSPLEFERFRNLVDSPETGRPVGTTTGTTRTYADAVADHVQAIAGNRFFKDIRGRLSRRPVRIGIDAVNGAAAEAAPQLAEALGVQPVRLNCRTDLGSSGAGFPRPPEPVAGNLANLSQLVRQQELEFGVGFDPDGDRASFVDETGSALGEEATVCLACLYLLPLMKGQVVVNLSTTRAVEDICQRFSAPVSRSPVGEAAVVERMLATRAVLGGEGNGGVIFPELNTTRDGLIALAVVLGLTSSRQLKLSELRREIPHYQMAKRALSLDRKRFEERKERLLREFGGASVDTRDGLRLDAADYWLHVRPSNTEPVLRIIAETTNAVRPEEIAERAQAVLT